MWIFKTQHWYSLQQYIIINNISLFFLFSDSLFLKRTFRSYVIIGNCIFFPLCEYILFDSNTCWNILYQIRYAFYQTTLADWHKCTNNFFSFHFIFLHCLSCVCELGCSVHGIRSLILFAYSKSFTMTIEIPKVILFSFILKFNGIFPDFSGNEISSNSFSSTISVINILLHNYFHFAVNFTCFHSIQRTMPFQLNWIQFNEFRSQFRFVVIFYSHDDKYVFCQCDKFIQWFELWLTGKWEHGTNYNFLTAN